MINLYTLQGTNIFHLRMRGTPSSRVPSKGLSCWSFIYVYIIHELSLHGLYNNALQCVYIYIYCFFFKSILFTTKKHLPLFAASQVTGSSVGADLLYPVAADEDLRHFPSSCVPRCLYQLRGSMKIITKLLLMAEILHQLIGSFSHYL